jgi:hypothetical protein
MCLSALCALPATACAANVWDTYDGAAGVSKGVTCYSFNEGGRMAWWRAGGDWVDASGRLWGNLPHGSAPVRAYQTGNVSVDVTAALANGNRAVMLRRSGGVMLFHSRESPYPPRLLVTLANGAVVSLSPVANATIAQATSDNRCVSAYPLGQSPRLSTLQGVVIEFPTLPAGFARAVLQLTIETAYADSTLQVFMLKKPRLPAPPVTSGFAERYPGDRGICSAPGVLYCENWDDDPKNWWKRTGLARFNESWLNSNGVRFPPDWTHTYFAPGEGYRGGNAIKVTYPTNGIYGTYTPTADFVGLGYGEQEHLFYRYYIKYSSQFRDAASCDGGKHPGFAADTTIAGNGGVPVDGTNGWSLRGGYVLNCDRNNPVYPRVILSTYAYYADMVGNYGQHWPWTGKGDGGLAPLGEWICIEGEVKVNTPGVRDGVLRTWMNGQLAYEKTDLFLRRKPPYKIPGNLGIRKFWGTLHHGGVSPFGKDVSVWMDQAVVAKSRIGCRVD